MEKFFYGKHKTRNIIIYFVILISWLAFIFSNSLANGSLSSAQSGRVVKLIRDIVSVFDSEAMVDAGDVRTAAHFFEFFVLGFIYYLGSFFIKGKRASLLLHSLALSLFTAFVDETLQLTSDGRVADIADMWVDFSGAIIAHMITLAVYASYKYFKKKG